MSSKETPYDSTFLIGNTAFPRATLPTLRSFKRRNDPDGISSTPYYPGIVGKSLDIQYTDSAEVEQLVTFTASSTSYPALITSINTLDPTNLEALDQGGFLVLRNKNPGGRHFIWLLPQAVVIDEAADLLGFVTDPFPGSVSYAGELLTAPSNRQQASTQGTSLVTRDEDLTAEAVNRGLVSVLRAVDRLRTDLERDVLVVRKISVFPGLHPVTGNPAFFVNSPTLRLPIGVMGVGSYPGVGDNLDSFFELVTSLNNTLYTDNYEKVQVLGVYYGDDTDTPLTATSFGTWGTPDGGSIYGTDVPNKTKHAATAVTVITGNIVHCPGALFVTNFVQKNDPVKITGALNLSPFSHNGWFAVLNVIDEERLVLRPLSVNEDTPDGDTDRPRDLNSSGFGFGDLSVHFGKFVPCSSMWFTLSTLLSPCTLRLTVGVPLREVKPDDLVVSFRGSDSFLGAALKSHIDDVGNAHAAASVSGFTSAVPWHDATTVSGADLKVTIENLIQDLARALVTDSGSRRVGAEAISIGGAAPNNLSAGSIFAQLTELLTTLQTHVLDGVAHAGLGAPYAGSGPWADGTSIPGGLSVELALDQIIADLADSTVAQTGSTRLGSGALPAWLNGSAIAAGTLFSQLSAIISQLGSQTVADDGAEKVGAQASGNLSVGSVRSQLTQLATEWARMASANTFSQTQTLDGPASDTSAALKTAAFPVTRKLLWEIAVIGPRKIRFYSVAGTGLEITHNVAWNGANWVEDTDATSSKVVFDQFGFRYYAHHSTDDGAGTWADGNFKLTSTFNTSLDSAAPAAGTGLFDLGSNFLASILQSQIPRLTAKRALNATTGRTLLFEFRTQEAGGHHARVYLSSSDQESLELTFNARWDRALGVGGEWVPDTTSGNRSKLRFSRNKVTTFARDAGVGNHDDGTTGTGWAKGTTSDLNLNVGDFAVIGESLADYFLPLSVPNATTAIENQVTASNVPKVWARFNSALGVTTLHDGFNVTSITRPDNWTIRITFAQDFGSSLVFAPFFFSSLDAGGGTSGGFTFSFQNWSAGSVDIWGFGIGGTDLNFNGYTFDCAFMAMGLQ